MAVTDRVIRISGGGIAASVLALQAIRRGLKVEGSWQGPAASSLLASGIYNPIVLKRMKLVWRWKEALSELEALYAWVDQTYGQHLLETEQVHQRLDGAQKLNEWDGLRADTPWSELLGTPVRWNEQWVGPVLRSGWVRVPRLLAFAQAQMAPCSGEPVLAQVHCHGWADGVRKDGLSERSFNPVKGEVLRVLLPGYDAPGIVHGPVFILPLGEGCYQVGATYQWDALDEMPSEKGKMELVKGLRSLWDGSFEIVEHRAAVRPATADRRPLVGAVGPGEWVLNGLGSRGILLAPLLAAELLDQILGVGALSSDVDPSRFPGS